MPSDAWFLAKPFVIAKGLDDASSFQESVYIGHMLDMHACSAATILACFMLDDMPTCLEDRI